MPCAAGPAAGPESRSAGKGVKESGRPEPLPYPPGRRSRTFARRAPAPAPRPAAAAPPVMARSSSPPVSEAAAWPEVLVHADESCLGNQFTRRANPGGAAALVEFWTGNSWRRRDYWTSDPDTTNNRMALSSAIGPLGALVRPCRIRFVSDSQYLTRGMTEWLPGWKVRGWRRKGRPIRNLDLWRELDRAARRHEIEWVWVRGHAGNVRNEYANHLAVRAAGELDRSEGFAESGFGEWLAGERAEAARYLDFDEHAAPRPFA